MDPALAGRVALMRFGLGPSRTVNLPSDFWTRRGAAYEACMAELEAPTGARITNADVNEFMPAGLLLKQSEAGALANGSGRESFSFRQDRQVRYHKHLKAQVGFIERLALFWMNHFNMYAGGAAPVRAKASIVERDIIRKHTLGRFAHMLLGVSQSSAMLTYLDGRNSNAIKTNQNFAREILELHTLGSSRDYADRQVEQAANYSQEDVESLAKIMTGWGAYHDANDAPWVVDRAYLVTTPTNFGSFTFQPRNHVPGQHTLLGKSFPGPADPNSKDGVKQGIEALKFLASHPLTAQHIARKLLCHFVSDTPSEAAVTTIAQEFTSSGGNLKSVAQALLGLEEAWTTPLLRLRQPYPWFISVMRGLGIEAGALCNICTGFALGTPTTFQDLIDSGDAGYLNVLGQQPWGWPTPDGFPDRDAYWKSGEAMRFRANMAYNFFVTWLTRYPSGFPPSALAASPRPISVKRVPVTPDGRIAKIQQDSVYKSVPQTTNFTWSMPTVSGLVPQLLGNATLSSDTAAALAKLSADQKAALALLFASPEYLLA